MSSSSLKTLTKEACLEFLRKSRTDAPAFLSPEQKTQTVEFLDFLTDGVSPFHAVAALATRLEKAGFRKLNERREWGTLAEGRYYFTRNQSTLAAFVVPKCKRVDGFTVVGAHTDSPCLKVKPVSAIKASGQLLVGVETYGGGLWHTWFDRDLSVAGRVMVRKADGGFQSKLVRIDRGILRISSLAIHLDRAVRDEGFKFNNETHLVPALATAAALQLNAKATGSSSADDSKTSDTGHHSILIELLATELKVEASAIVDLELCLFDTQKPALGGILNEFVYSARLDNLCSCFMGVKALTCSAVLEAAAAGGSNQVPVLFCFDNEEVGSTSHRGADSVLAMSVFRRVLRGRGGVEALDAVLQRSLLVSADNAHAVHPCYSGKHEARHSPQMQGGLVIKYNANQRYATSMRSAHFVMEACRKVEASFQKFVVRQDSSCGSTIGPMLSSQTGMRTVDVGIAQLSMHSIREICGIKDVVDAIAIFAALYLDFVAMDDKCLLD